MFLLDNPNHERETILLANTLIEGELDLEEGLELVNALLERYPKRLGLLDCKAFALHKLGRHQEALELLEMNTAKYKAFNERHNRYLQEVREAVSGNK